MKPLSEFWLGVAGSLGFAFQPIVNVHSGTVYGFEALLRGAEEAGFASIPSLFDEAFADGVLFALDCRLRETALGAFAALPSRGSAKLFFNLDNRITEVPDYVPGNTQRLLGSFGLVPADLVFEVSERHEFSDYHAARRILEVYKGQEFSIAVDDFGAGYAGLQLLYFAHPDFIKIDRFFVAGIDADPRKRQFVERIVDLAHLMGIQVIAEGVETEGEFLTCRRVGCDLAQGFLIARPERSPGALQSRYPAVAELAGRDRRRSSENAELLRALADPIRPVRLGDDVLSVLERFRAAGAEGRAVSVIPVLDRDGTCVGVLRERDFRKYVYSPYGIALLRHESSDKPLGGLVAAVPVLDARADLRSVQNLFLGNSDADGVVLSEDGAYAGFLDARSILRAVTDRELADARDQNPLSRLPGNARLEEYLAERWDDPAAHCVLCYYDFNDFKPFNDHYGFRRGDRVILLFADILRGLAASGWFVAHIGGDDFFAGRDCASAEEEREALAALDSAAVRFAADVESFYDADDRSRGWMDGHDRSGAPKRFPLLSVSAAAFSRRPGPPPVPLDQAGEFFARLKREAKEGRAAFSPFPNRTVTAP